MTRDTEDTTYRGYPIQVRTDRIIVTGPNRTHAEFNSMARARKFIRSLALTDGGSAKSEIRAPDSPPDRLAVPPPSASATTTEPGVTPDASRGPTANGKPAGPSDLVALNYLRGMGGFDG